MALSPGARLGPYEITARIGVGGMGEVYRAKDTRLPREAAVKVSAERFSERFAGEAKIIASLNHPNISTLYDVGDDYLVMELVEGPTLAERISLRPFVYGGAMAVSPDGHWLVFPARGEDGVVRYWVRSLETVEARVLPGTEGAFVPAAWTSDSRYVVFTPLGGATMTPIKKVDIQGGPPQVLGEMLGAFNGATSSKDGVILFGSSQLRAPVFRVPAAGGAVAPVTVVAEGDVAHRFPQFLPDGRRFLYLRISPDPDKMGVYVGSIDAGPEAQSHDRVLATNRQAYYAPGAVGGPGHLIFLRDGTLMAQPFDPDRLTLNGEAVSIAEGVESYAGQSYGMFSVSDSGTLAYRSGVGEKLSVTWLDQKGRLERVLGDLGEYANPAVSPDASRIAVAQGKGGARDMRPGGVQMARNCSS